MTRPTEGGETPVPLAIIAALAPLAACAAAAALAAAIDRRTR